MWTVSGAPGHVFTDAPTNAVCGNEIGSLKSMFDCVQHVVRCFPVIICWKKGCFSIIRVMSVASNAPPPKIADFVQLFSSKQHDLRSTVRSLCRRSSVDFLNKPFHTPNGVQSRHTKMTLLMLAFHFRVAYLDIWIDEGVALCRRDGLHDELIFDILCDSANLRHQRSLLQNLFSCNRSRAVEDKLCCFFSHFTRKSLAQQLLRAQLQGVINSHVDLLIHNYCSVERSPLPVSGRVRVRDWCGVLEQQRKTAIDFMILFYFIPTLIVAKIIHMWSTSARDGQYPLDEARLYRIASSVRDSCNAIKGNCTNRRV